MSDDGRLNPKFIAALDAVRRTGAISVQIRYQDDEEPVVWVVVAEHLRDARGLPVGRDREPAEQIWTVGGGLEPTTAAVRCAEQLVDGGTCAHCTKPAALDPDGDLHLPGFCLLRWRAKTATFVQDCQ